MIPQLRAAGNGMDSLFKILASIIDDCQDEEREGITVKRIFSIGIEKSLVM